MSFESPWLGVLGAIVVPALGHLYHFILAVNITSGWGLRETNLARLRLVLVAILVASSTFLLARHVQDPWWNWGWPLRAYACLCLVSGGLIWPLTSLGLGMRRRPGGVDGRSDRGDLSLKHAIRIGHDSGLDLLAHLEARDLALVNVCQHPHGGDVGNRVGSRRAAGLYEQSRSGIARRDPAADRTWHHQRPVDPALGHQAIDFCFALAEDSHRIARRLVGSLGGLLI